jgi:hypothetical protein
LENGDYALTAHNLVLSQEVLASIRQRYPGRELGNKQDESRSTRAQIPYEVPDHVNRLLHKIGIDDADVPSDLVAGPPHMRSDRTAKLVGHIFECLDALQHLVRSNQCDITAETVSETQSMADMNTRSVGRLLHEMISICSLSGDTVKALVRANPEAAGIEDNFGRMPIHVACDREDPWVDVLQAIVEVSNIRCVHPTSCHLASTGWHRNCSCTIIICNPVSNSVWHYVAHRE